MNDEPNFPDTTEEGVPGNGFTEQGPGGATNVDSLDATADNPPPLILESYYIYDTFGPAVDINQLLNRAQHGEDYENYDYFIYPGFGYFGVYWGWFADKGDQADDVPGESNHETLAKTIDGSKETEDDYVIASYDEGEAADGEIFDDWDEEEDPKDEFVWHGKNTWANLSNHQSHPGDEMYGFVHPGTYEDSVNGPYNPINDGSDGVGQPDFQMSDRTDQEGQSWVSNNGFPAGMVANSLFITTNVTMATNPPSGSSGNTFNPTPDDRKFDGDQRYDIDLYQTVNPTATELYRTAVWDPNDEVDSPTDAVHPNATKGFVRKDLVPTANDAIGAVFENVSDATHAVQPQQGAADDRVFPAFPHEPNHEDDEYTFAPDNHEATYGGLDGNYYDPQTGADAYDTYEDEEHAWLDAYGVYSTNIYGAAIYGSGGFFYFHPETSTEMSEDDARRGMLPGQFTVNANFGSWLDTNGDSFVGGDGADNEPRSHPYQNGTVDDPNQYGSDEFRGTCGASWDIKVYPHNNDPDGDDTDEWGTMAIRIHNENGRSDDPVIQGFDGHPYPELVGDATGGVGPVNDGDGEARSYFRLPGDEDPLPIQIDCQDDQTGNWDAVDVIDLPTGTLDHGLKVVTEVSFENNRTARDDAGNAGNDLVGESIVDVDIIKAYELN